MEANTKPNLRAIAFALAALTATVPSLAQARGEAPSEKVYYGDLNLTSEAGVKVLDRRLDRAVERVCGTSSVRSLQTERLAERCREDTWASIRDDREVAIAHANNRQGIATARVETETNGRVQVSLAAE